MRYTIYEHQGASLSSDLDIILPVLVAGAVNVNGVNVNGYGADGPVWPSYPPAALRRQDVDESEQHKKMWRRWKFKEACREFDREEVATFKSRVWEPLMSINDLHEKIIISQGTATRALKHANRVIQIITGVTDRLDKLAKSGAYTNDFRVARELLYTHLGRHLSISLPGILSFGRHLLPNCIESFQAVDAFFYQVNGCSGAAIDPSRGVRTSHGFSDLLNSQHNLEESDKQVYDILKAIKAVPNAMMTIQKYVSKEYKIKNKMRGIIKLISSSRRHVSASLPAIDRYTAFEKSVKRLEVATVTLLRSLLTGLNTLDGEAAAQEDTRVNPKVLNFIKESIYTNLGGTLYKDSLPLRQEFIELCGGTIGQLAPYVQPRDSQPVATNAELIPHLSRSRSRTLWKQDENPFTLPKDSKERLRENYPPLAQGGTRVRFADTVYGR